MARKSSKHAPVYEAERPLDPDDAQFLLSLGVQAALQDDLERAREFVALGERILRAQTLLLAHDPHIFDWKADLLADELEAWEARRATEPRRA